MVDKKDHKAIHQKQRRQNTEGTVLKTFQRWNKKKRKMAAMNRKTRYRQKCKTKNQARFHSKRS